MNVSNQHQHQNKFPLSKIHRLLRPLRSSIISLKQELLIQINHQSTTTSSSSSSNQIYHEPKSIKRKILEESDYHPNQSKQNQIINQSIKRFSKPKKQQPTIIKPSSSHSTLISSPLFESTPQHSKPTPPIPPKKAYYGQKRLIKRLPIKSRNKSFSSSSSANSFPSHSIQIETKLQKLIAAYKNILDSVLHSQESGSTSSSSIQLTVICAQVIGFHLESILLNQSRSNCNEDDEEEEDVNQISLIEEEDWKTSVMDEWYDAIPINHRKYALAQHSLSLILMEFGQETQSSFNLSSDLLYKLHHLHRTYPSSILINSQASKLLTCLFNLNQIDWYELYDASFHQFNLKHQFLEHFYQRTKPTTFLTHWSNWNYGLIGFIDKSIQDFILVGMTKWLEERQKVLRENEVKQEEILVGMRSSASDDEFDDEYNCELIEEFDEKTRSVILKWIGTLLKAALPNSIHSVQARDQFDLISDLVFGAIRFDASYSQPQSQSQSTSTSDHHSQSPSQSGSNSNPNLSKSNYLLIFISLLIESHRFTLSNLSIFNLPFNPTCTPLKPAKPKPTKLIKLINFTKHDPSLLSKVSKHFLRSHQCTELFGIVGHQEYVIPGLNQLFEVVWMMDEEAEGGLKALGKVWIECLLKSDPAAWWNGEDGCMRFGRDWLEDWLNRLNGNRDRNDEEREEVDGMLSLTLGYRKFRKIHGLEKGESKKKKKKRVEREWDGGGVRGEEVEDDEMLIGPKVSGVGFRACKDDEDLQQNLLDVVKSDEDEEDGDDGMMVDSKLPGVPFGLVEDDEGIRNSVDIKSDDDDGEEDGMMVNSNSLIKDDEDRQGNSLDIKSDEDDEEEEEMMINSSLSRVPLESIRSDEDRGKTSLMDVKSDDEMIINLKASRVPLRSIGNYQPIQSTSFNIKSEEEKEEEEEAEEGMRKKSKMRKSGIKPIHSFQESPKGFEIGSSEDEISFIKERFKTPIDDEKKKKKKNGLKESDGVDWGPKNGRKGKERFMGGFVDLKNEESDELDFLSARNRDGGTPWGLVRREGRDEDGEREGKGNGIKDEKGKRKGKGKGKGKS